MDAVGSERAALLGFSEGTALSALFAVSHPERTTGLILYDGFAAGPLVAPETHGWKQRMDAVGDAMDHWGEGESMSWVAPSLAGSAVAKRFWGAFERASMGPGMARALWESCKLVDVRDVLPSITVPTLVLNHADSFIPAAGGRLMADLIPGARYVELPGRDHLPGAGDPEAIAGEIEEFLTGARAAARPDRVLATVLFTDIVDSTGHAAQLGDSAWRQLRERHDALTRSQLERHRGREVKQTGDGFLASFDGPARAIRCACSIREEARELGIEIRAGLHTGECELIGDDIAGMAVHVAARVGARAQPSQVLVSGTVKDLVLGSGIEFLDQGTHELKGVPGEWRLFVVQADEGQAPASEPLSPARLRLTDRAARRLARNAPGLARFGARVLRPRASA
jgi:class 3 adenylate cyclase